MRPHIAAVYAFARVADDIADEGSRPAEERRSQLDAWQRRLHAALAIERAAERPHDHEDLIIVAVAHSIGMLDLPVALFDDLISAFEQDTMTSGYDSWRDVLDYCRRSANPIGRLVLRIGGYRSDTLDESSDALCSALQLTNFWQDVGRDWQAGRVYVPREVQVRCGAREEDLAKPVMTEGWMRAIDECLSFTDDLFARGRTVCDGVAGRLRYELRMTWLGGRRILERVSAVGRTLPAARPTLTGADIPLLIWRAVRWQRA
jgi:hydroxysqualene synthase